jgi:hypothetical protein
MASAKRAPKGISGKVSAAKERKEKEALRTRANAPEYVQATDEITDVEDEVLSAPLDADQLNHGVSCVKMKLSTFCPDDRIQRLLNNIVKDVNIALAEAYAFANLHVTRALERGTSVADVGAKFYDRCFMSVCKCSTRVDTDESFKATQIVFDSLRPAEDTPVDMTLLNDIKSELVIAMATMAANHLRTNLKSRLESWIAWRYPRFTKQIRTAIVSSVAIYPTVNLAAVPGLATVDSRGKECSDAKKASVKLAIDLINELRALAPLKGDASKLAVTKVAALIPLYYRIMKETEDAFAGAQDDNALKSEDKAVRVPATKLLKRLRRARFTLLPYKHGYTVSYVPICTRAWVGILRRVKRRDTSPLVPYKTNRLDDDHNNSAWKRHCNVNSVESKTRRFGGRIATDGYAVSVLMETTSARVLPEVNGAWDPRIIDKLVWDPSKLEWVGVDPGLTDVVTVYNEQTGKTTSYSSSRYYEDSKVKVSNRRTNAWNLEEAYTVDRNGNTALSSAAFYGSYLSSLRILLSHRMARGYRSMRFMRYVFKRKAIATICDLVSDPEKFTVVAFGDWNGPGKSPISRRHCGPLQEIKRELQKRTDTTFFRSVWECRTSMVCSVTKSALKNMVAASTKVDRRTGQRETGQRARVHKILHCGSSFVDLSRHGGTWNRDANAARNILMLLKLEVRGEKRPAEFMPATSLRGGRSPRGKACASKLTKPTVIPSVPELGGNIHVD